MSSFRLVLRSKALKKASEELVLPILLSLLLGHVAIACASDEPALRPTSMGGAGGDAGQVDGGGNEGGAAGAAGAGNAGGATADAGLGSDMRSDSREGSAGGAAGGSAADASPDAFGPGDGAARDGGFLGDPRCASASLALCDDFETVAVGGPPDSALWRVITSYADPQMSSANTVVVDTVHAARGQKALHVHTTTTDPVYIQTRALPVANNTFWGRVLAWFDVNPGAMTKGHWAAFVAIGKKGDAGQDIEVRIGGQFDILTINYFGNDANQISSSKDGDYSDGVRLAVRSWTCFEFLYKGDTHELRLFMQGKEIDQLHVTDWGQFGHTPIPNWSPNYDRVRIGYQSFNADTPVDVWYDSVAIDSNRIGCER
jgi:hypothetical protein